MIEGQNRYVPQKSVQVGRPDVRKIEFQGHWIKNEGDRKKTPNIEPTDLQPQISPDRNFNFSSQEFCEDRSMTVYCSDLCQPPYQCFQQPFIKTKDFSNVAFSIEKLLHRTNFHLEKISHSIDIVSQSTITS